MRLVPPLPQSLLRLPVELADPGAVEQDQPGQGIGLHRRQRHGGERTGAPVADRDELVVGVAPAGVAGLAGDQPGQMVGDRSRHAGQVVVGHQVLADRLHPVVLQVLAERPAQGVDRLGVKDADHHRGPGGLRRAGRAQEGQQRPGDVGQQRRGQPAPHQPPVGSRKRQQLSALLLSPGTGSGSGRVAELRRNSTGGECSTSLGRCPPAHQRCPLAKVEHQSVPHRAHRRPSCTCGPVALALSTSTAFLAACE